MGRSSHGGYVTGLRPFASPQCYAAIIDAPLLGKRKGAGVHYCEAPALSRALSRPATRCYRSGCSGSFATSNYATLLVYAATGCRRSATWPYRGGAMGPCRCVIQRPAYDMFSLSLQVVGKM